MLISIVIPCYNVQDYIEECVHSSYAQTYPHIEVICIDNNSSDSTWKNLKQLKQQYPKLIIDKETKSGSPAARNKGLSLSKGELIQFLDADDLLMPEKIEHQVSIFKENPDCSFIAGSYLKQDLSGKDTPQQPVEQNPFKSLFTTQLGITSSNLWKKSSIKSIGGWNESLKSSQEADLMFRLLQQNDKVAHDREPLTIVRERESGQISQRNPHKKWLVYLDCRIQIVDWLKTNQPAYFKKESFFFLSGLFQLIRLLAKYDLELANQKRKQIFKQTFPPIKRRGFYYWAYRIGGFKNAERIARIYS
ncbi:glycosyltransferase family 2 protein [Marinilabilia rubra]|uniref:Glycosyltransferase family 2 protein n=1 Tax=Marinilabilia rubra TaxID=2162893 RepID=A0A2U2B3X6_9BACT|nr:glycosyltransferase family A protein [Marinilabilia rubra]PWD97763.1 glycosyltransferase family 2 protein [Marinilabilia rubra]